MLSVTERAEIAKLISEGLGDAEIGKRIGRHRSTITKFRLQRAARNVTTEGKSVNFRLSSEEHRAFKEAMEAKNLTISEGGRRLVRASLGLIDLDREEINALHLLRKELNAIGININQLTTLAQSGRLNWNAGDSRKMDLLDRKIDVTVNQIVALVTAGRNKAFVRSTFPVEGQD
tara:strand:+ start:103 stop:627 length:525 start_codon:yes stop_codon:yes gene_type:complete